MPRAEEYIAIEAWGRDMGSYPYYIKDQQERAAATNAPLDAIFENVEPGGLRTGVWSTVSELRPDHRFRAVYEKALRVRRGVRL